MNKLIARRPVLYRGRSYRRGEALPANDRLMAEAWLRAGSAAWGEAELPEAGRAERLRAAEQQAADVLAYLGVDIVDGDGAFVGEDELIRRITAAARDPEALEGFPESRILDVGPDGHFSREDLSRLSKAELLDLAEDLGVDLGKCRTNAERAEALAAVDAEAVLEGGGAPAGEGPA